MRRVLISMEKKITDRHLDVEADIPEEPILVLGDNDMITQVIYNLLENAAKFATQGHHAVSGRGYAMDGKARVTVRNVGETIRRRSCRCCLSGSTKATNPAARTRTAWAWGLYIVKTILEQHKEKINVTSENGVTTFTFSLAME